ncbi:CBS domain-containing protein [Nonomuraea phyllanthi]|uniref:CBS domain-containing protein n=1 Tax=Nonomuraea phyllanthi TaxID=2219224 RepID=A0A5C4VVZ8_9ACTN|nr:CBS domain-containing protein [Nonomuraea phyllanthi]KAB8190340.1 CBS domain-containing protein [Nonomuraea phyllanthi]
MSLEVKDIMGHVAIAVLRDASFAEIVAAMERFAVGAVTVIDADRRPVGVVSEDDLILKEAGAAAYCAPLFESRAQRQERRKAAGVTAGQLMTSPPITVTPRTPVREAAQLMHVKRVKQLPVVDPATGRIVGTLHQRDVLRVFTRPVQELEADVRAALPEPGTFAIDIDGGVVTIRGVVEWRSQALSVIERLWLIDGVVDVKSEVAFEKDDLLAVPAE